MNEHDHRWVKNFGASQRRQVLKEQAVAYLGGACKVCGYDRCIAAFDFHHLSAQEKDFNVSSKSSWATIRPELDKCVLLCSTCHREVHAGLHPRFLDLEGRSSDYGDFD